MDVNLKSGIIKNIFSEQQLENWKNVFKKYCVPTKSKLGDDCFGIDINSTRAYLWYTKELFPEIKRIFDRADLKTIFAMYAKFTRPFQIHHDVKPIPNNMKGQNYISCLMPLAVNGDPKLCNQVSTAVFDEKENPSFEDDHNNLFQHCSIEDLKKFTVRENYNWNRGDLIWWDSRLYHSSCDFTQKFKNKEAFVIHTYV